MQTQFLTTGGALYQVAGLTAEQAADFGCPGADVMLTGHLGHMIGVLVATGTVPGRAVRVPGWSAARLGVRAQFVSAVLEDGDEPVDGWLGQD